MYRSGVFLAALTFAPAAASAQLVHEVRLGLADHNVCVINCDNADKEAGLDISGEVVLHSPGFLKLIAAPRPYVLVSVNTKGNTSFAGFGAYWNLPLPGEFSLEPGVGYVVHDGSLNFPFPQGDPRNDPVSARTVYLGSRDLFRTSLALNYELDGPLGLQVFYEHLSHGQIIGQGRNQGLDNLGIRVRYAFGG